MMKKLILAFTLISNTCFSQNYVTSFNGSTSYVDMGNSLYTNVRTVSFWFKPGANVNSSIPNAQAFIMRDDNSNIDEFGVIFSGPDVMAAGGPGKVAVYFRTSLSTYYWVESISASWLSTDWHHVGFTVDATAGMKLYIDGSLEDIDLTWTGPVPTATEMIAIGKWGDESLRYYNGRIEELAFWNYALSASEISAKMCTPLNIVSETGLVAYYKMNEGSGLSLIDQTGSFNGTVNGSTWVVDSTCVDFISVNEIDARSKLIDVYPNPTLETFSFQLPTDERGNFSLVITDLAGKTILQKNVVAFNGSPIITDVHTLASGTYIVNVSNENLSYSGKFVKE